MLIAEFRGRTPFGASPHMATLQKEMQ